MTNNPTDPIQAAIDALNKGMSYAKCAFAKAIWDKLPEEEIAPHRDNLNQIEQALDQLRQFQRDKIVIDRADVPERICMSIEHDGFLVLENITGARVHGPATEYIRADLAKPKPIDGLREAVKWMQLLQGPKDPRVPDQGKVDTVLQAARAYLEMSEGE